MPKFMDVHHGMVGITADALVAAHAGDLAIQADEGVNFEHAWADPESGNVFCLSEAPSAEAVQRIAHPQRHPARRDLPAPARSLRRNEGAAPHLTRGRQRRQRTRRVCRNYRNLASAAIDGRHVFERAAGDWPTADISQRPPMGE